MWFMVATHGMFLSYITDSSRLVSISRNYSTGKFLHVINPRKVFLRLNQCIMKIEKRYSSDSESG